MKNKLVKVIILFISIFVFFILYLFLFSDIKKPEYKIFKYETDGYYMNKFIGMIPKSYLRNLVKEEYENTDEYIIYRFCDTLLNYTCKHEYLFLKFKSSKIKGFLKAPPYYYYRQEKLTDTSNIMNKVLDLALFKEIVYVRNLNSEEEIIELYLDLLDFTKKDTIFNFVEFKKINKIADLDSLQKKYGNPLIEYNINSIKDSTLQNRNIYWTYYYGVIELFVIRDNKGKFKDFKVTLLGNNGNEYYGIW